MDPNFGVAHYQLGQALAQKHLHDEAIAEFQRAIELSGHSGAFDSNLAYVYAVSGRKVEAEYIIRAWKHGLIKILLSTRISLWSMWGSAITTRR
jgi:Flp pilus assembly protein TadD